MALRELPTIRNYVARIRCKADMTRTLWLDTVTAMETGREDVMLRVLECKAVAGETALDVLATAMRVCGGAAYRRDVGVERYFRDAQASSVMAPTGFGAKDSPQARLIPIQLLHGSGITQDDFTAKRFDVLVGKHGDHLRFPSPTPHAPGQFAGVRRWQLTSCAL